MISIQSNKPDLIVKVQENRAGRANFSAETPWIILVILEGSLAVSSPKMQQTDKSKKEKNNFGKKRKE